LEGAEAGTGGAEKRGRASRQRTTTGRLKSGSADQSRNRQSEQKLAERAGTGRASRQRTTTGRLKSGSADQSRNRQSEQKLAERAGTGRAIRRSAE